MRILVTGGAGFIGSNVADALIADGHAVGIADNLVTGLREFVPNAAVFEEVDVASDEFRAFARKFKPEVICHHAAHINVRVSVEDPVYDAKVNVLGTLNVLRAATESGARRVTFASSGGAVYGDPPRERLPVDEEYPAQPLSPYGVSKRAGELYGLQFAANNLLEFVALRYPNIFGPRQTPRSEAGVVSIFMENLMNGRPCTIFGDGGKTRDYLFVGDVVAANRLALVGPRNRIFNLGWGRQISDMEMYRACSSQFGVTLAPILASKRPGEVDFIALD
ncbi:MAG: NAD-dependent epimerase/dehydratase family protein, partial [Planctomycetota bacterium]